MTEPESAPPPKPKARPKRSRPQVTVCSIERMSRILAEARLDGTDAVARRWKIHPRTIGRYLAKSRTDPALAAEVERKSRQLAEEWRKEGAAALGILIRRMVELSAEKGVSLRDVSGAMHLLASHVVAAEAVLGKDGRLPDAPSESPPAPAGGPVAPEPPSAVAVLQ